MSETPTRDPWHDTLLATVRARAEQSRRRRDTTPPAHVPVYNWPEVSSLLSRAAARAVADATIPVDRRHTGLRRALILAVRRFLASLLRFLTARQSDYNRAVLEALHQTGRAVRSLEKRLAARDEQLRRLRERISRLEQHLSAETTRKAS
jgi:hypothetical protein